MAPNLIVESVFWRIPAIILVLFLLEKRPSFYAGRDGAVLGLCFPALCLLGFLVSLGAGFSGFSAPPVPVPAGLAGWTGAVLLSLGGGYLEESYFRVYLPARIKAAAPSPAAPRTATPGWPAYFFVPVLLFGLCHIYEGPWGIVNAVLAGSLLALAYNKTASFHGIALAHGLYNVFVYLAAVKVPLFVVF